MGLLSADRRFMPREPRGLVSTSQLLSSLSFALDLTEGVCPGHAIRTCILGTRIARELGLGPGMIEDLYYASLLKDVGCSCNAGRLHQVVGDDEIHAKHLTKTTDWTRLEWSQVKYLLRYAHRREGWVKRLSGVKSMIEHRAENAALLVRLRCEKGAKIVTDLGLTANVARAIYGLDEHWDGQGYPGRLVGEEIPILSRVLSLAQTLEVFHREYGEIAAEDVLRRRSGRWFDPAIVKAVLRMMHRGSFWRGLGDHEVHLEIALLEPVDRTLRSDATTIDSICEAFAEVVDAKSHYTYTHSSGVAQTAVRIGEELKLPAEDLTTLRRAGLLHDIGKLSVPNSILDKTGLLTAQERALVQSHPQFTFEILSQVGGFEEIARVAANHHEKLDGTGYFRGLKGDQLCTASRVLTVADVFDALSGDRPYRERMSSDEVLAILKREAPHAMDGECIDALGSALRRPSIPAELLPVYGSAAGTMAFA